MLLLGIDLGTSSVKVSVVDAGNGQIIAGYQYPQAEMEILSPQRAWAEQSPDLWWENVQQAILGCHSTKTYDPADIGAIGIAYQMHGLVMIDKEGRSLRNAIIWCDGRAIALGDAAFEALGEQYCLSSLLNSPGNFTASKLAWVKENEPEVFSRIHKIMLPGDYIAFKLTGDITTTASALSEGVFWNFKEASVSGELMAHFGFSSSLLPSQRPLFSSHGELTGALAMKLSLKKGIPVSYKAGDQLNNAFSLNVLQPGEVAATAGTSGVIYGVSDELRADNGSRINSFAHVNHEKHHPRIGVLLCINGTGIANSWMKNIAGNHLGYEALNSEAASVRAGADGLRMLPFGNGPERMLGNRLVGAHLSGLDFNKHRIGHMARAVQEGIAFSFRYGLDIMRENGMYPSIIRAGLANMFLSDVFASAFVNATGVPVELYRTDGSAGAALGAGLGAGIFTDASEAFAGTRPIKRIEPEAEVIYNRLYADWKEQLQLKMRSITNMAEAL